MTQLLGIETSKKFEEIKSQLIKKFEPEFLMKEKTELNICYPKDNNKKMDMFLFNNQENKEQFVLTRNYYKEGENEKYKVITDLVDDKFLTLLTIMQLVDFKQTYIIESDIYKIGDLTIEFSKMYLKKETNKYKFIFCINNLYGHTFQATYDFTIDVMTNLFDDVDENKLAAACGVNSELLEKYNLTQKKIIIERNKEQKEIKKEEIVEDNFDNINSEKSPQIKLIQYLHYL